MGSRIGIIANPAAGKDVRRLVTEARTVTANEKVALLRRMLAGALAAGVGDIMYMPDASGLVERAARGLPGASEVRLLPMPIVRRNSAEDSAEAARLMADANVGAVLTLGGDGTNRVIAQSIADVPLLPLSTGTNNAFPQLTEATLAGLALGLVAGGAADQAVHRRKRLEVLVDGQLQDIALVDVAVLSRDPRGAQAIWHPEDVRELFLAQAAATSVGWSAVLGAIEPLSPIDPYGARVTLDSHAAARVLAPIAPGVVAEVGIASVSRLGLKEAIALGSKGRWLALDGEPCFRAGPGERVEIQVALAGPRVIDVARALEIGAMTGALRRGDWPSLQED